MVSELRTVLKLRPNCFEVRNKLKTANVSVFVLRIGEGKGVRSISIGRYSLGFFSIRDMQSIYTSSCISEISEHLNGFIISLDQ